MKHRQVRKSRSDSIEIPVTGATDFGLTVIHLLKGDEPMNDAEREILKLEEELTQTEMRLDVDALDRIYAKTSWSRRRLVFALTNRQ